MKFTVRIFMFVAFISIISQSCQKAAISDFTPSKSFTNVQEELWPYFERFEAEAKSRGFHIDLEKVGIIGTVEHLEHKHAVGTCYHQTGQPNAVILDTDFWATATESMKELIVFHELGHCYLGRGHNNDSFEDGRCKSIMRDGLGNSCISLYNNSYRSYYLNELFQYED